MLSLAHVAVRFKVISPFPTSPTHFPSSFSCPYCTVTSLLPQYNHFTANSGLSTLPPSHAERGLVCSLTPVSSKVTHPTLVTHCSSHRLQALDLDPLVATLGKALRVSTHRRGPGLPEVFKKTHKRTSSDHFSQSFRSLSLGDLFEPSEYQWRFATHAENAPSRRLNSMSSFFP